jgi:hypothetical protein
MISHEFEFLNNIAYIHHVGTRSEMVVQPFNPVTQLPWASEEEAREWALRDYGYLLVNNVPAIPTVATYTELPGWPTSYTGTEYAYITSDTGARWHWNGQFWYNTEELIKWTITGTITSHTELPGYPSSYTGNPGVKYLVSSTDHIWRWNGLVWDDEGKYNPNPLTNIGE